jgi:hypothetical protein
MHKQGYNVNSYKVKALIGWYAPVLAFALNKKELVASFTNIDHPSALARTFFLNVVATYAE